MTSASTGGKKAAQMTAEHQQFLDAQPTVTNCAFCKTWKFEGTAAQGRLEAERHRQEKHPARAAGGALTAAFEARKKRRKPWTAGEILDAFRRFEAEFGLAAVPNDIPLCPYLPSMNTVMKVFGSWSTARERSQKPPKSGPLPPPPEPTPAPPPAPAAPQRRTGRDTAPVPEDPQTRLRRLLHELVDAVVDHLAPA